jgi:L-alanine-DL-glutamate epimerase-like enolase superfamily enzyme
MSYDTLRDPNAEYTMRDLSQETLELSGDRGDLRSVEITDVQSTIVDGNYPWTLVRVYTDAGIVGNGEAYWGGALPEIVERLKTFVVGENPLDIDRLYEHMVQKMSGEGSIAGKDIAAISGIEIALHDAAGKVLNVPAYQLLGGKYRDSVRMYCDCHTENEADPEACAHEAQRVVEELGYDALKFDLDVPSGHEKDRANRHLRRPEINHKAEIVKRVTDQVGDKADAAFDCHWAFSSGSAKRLALELEQYDVWWLEDPVPPENYDVQCDVSRSSATPIATGENVYRMHGQRRLITEQAVDILAPDVPKVGGMRETMKIASLAELFYVPLALHNVSSPIGTMASAHVAAAIPNALAVEYHSYELGWWEDLVEEDDLIKEGYMDIRERPGLGITLDLNAVQDELANGQTMFDEV